MKRLLWFYIFLKTCCIFALVQSLVSPGPTLPCKACLQPKTLGDVGVCELEDQQAYHPCRCDSDCEVYGDCCPTTLNLCLNRSKLVVESDENQSFKCQDIFLAERRSVIPGNGEHYWMVATCLAGWKVKNRDSMNVQDIERNCLSNSINLPPVTDPSTGLVYRNEHCAVCNGVSNMSAWEVQFMCDFELDRLLADGNYTLTADDFNRFCTALSFIEPASLPAKTKPARQCYPQVETCLDLDTLVSRENNVWNSSYYYYLNELCTGGHFQYHMINRTQPNQIPYRNEHCALCNDIDRDFIECFMGPPDNQPGFGIMGPVLVIIFDIFGNGRTEMATSSTISVEVFCSQVTEVFDPVTKQCRQTLIMEKCNGTNGFSDNDSNCTKCTGELIVLMDSTMYTFTDTNTLVYNDELYAIESNTSDGSPIICVNFSTNGTNITNTINFETFTYPPEYTVLIYIGCSLSVVGCLMILLTYTLFKELRTLPSLLLMQLAVAILFGNLLVLFLGPLSAAIKNAAICTITAIFSHYVFLAQFIWMSVMSTEIARNLYRASKMKTKESKRYKLKLLTVYMLIGWGFPLLIVLLAVIVNFTKTTLVQYGRNEDGTQGICWINHRTSVFVSLMGPLAITLTYNAILFVFITVYLIKSSRSSSKLHVTNKGNVSFARLNVAVFFVSGVTWLFAFLAFLPHFGWAWIPYIIVNSTQGFVIFLLFLCTRRVAFLYVSFFFRRNTKTSTSISTKESLRSSKGQSQSDQELDVCREKGQDNTSNTGSTCSEQ